MVELHILPRDRRRVRAQAQVPQRSQVGVRVDSEGWMMLATTLTPKQDSEKVGFTLV